MTSDDLLCYSGRFPGEGLADLVPGPVVVTATRGAEGVVIRDPLSFPWEQFDAHEPDIPMIIDTCECSPDDLMALRPVLERLTNSDALLGDPETVELVSADLGLTNRWLSDDADFVQHVRSTATAKLADIEERLIVERFLSDEDLIVIVIPGAAIRSARAGFEDLIRGLREANGGAPLEAVWGVRPQPGAPVERAVVALRRGQLHQ